MIEMQLCNGGCNQVRPVYKWMKAAFDRPYPYCKKCFPKNWAPMEGGEGYLLIDKHEALGYWEFDKKGEIKGWKWYDS